MQQSQLNQQNFLGNVGALSSLNSNNFNQYLQAAGLSNQIANQSPQVGLSGSSIANLAVGNQNAQAQYAQNIGNANAGLTSGIAGAIGTGITGGYNYMNPTNQVSPFGTFQQANGGYGSPTGYGANSGQYGMFAAGAPAPNYSYHP